MLSGRYRIGVVLAASMLAIVAGTAEVKAQAYGGSANNRAYALDEISVEELIDQLRPETEDSKSYRPRRTHVVSAQDLSVCSSAISGRSKAFGETKSLVEKFQSPHVILKIGFSSNSIAVPPSDQASLEKLAAALGSPVLSRARYVIEGHTDAVGSRRYNDRLSCERAAVVRQVLRERYGVGGERLLAVGFGFRDLLDRENPAAGVNRRVVIRLLKD